MKNTKLIIVLVAAAAVLIWIFSKSKTAAVAGPVSPGAIAGGTGAAATGLAGAFANIGKSISSIFSATTSGSPAATPSNTPASVISDPFSAGNLTNDQWQALIDSTPAVGGASDPTSGVIDDTGLLTDPSAAEDAPVLV
jgi:hypothetical protein